MENDNLGFPPDRERIEYIERTINKHSAHDDVDIREIVVNAMNAYWNPRIEESIAPDLETTTAAFLRDAAQRVRNPRADIVNGLLGILAPSLTYLVILYLLLSYRGDWDTPIPRKIIILFVSLPVALAITLVFVSGPRREFKANPLGVLRDNVARFMTSVQVGAAFTGLLLTAVATAALVYTVDAQRETRTISFNSAKTILVDKSLSTMKDLQAFPDTKVAETRTEIKLSANNVFSIRAQNSFPQSKRIKYVIEDQGTFPGQLTADFDAGSGTISWKDEGKSAVVQTQMYVCKIKEIVGGIVYVDALNRSTPEDKSRGNNASATSAGASALEQRAASNNNSVINAISLNVNGTTIELTFNPELVNAHALSKGQNLVLAFDTQTRVASRIEPILTSQSGRNTGSSTE